MMAAAAAMAEVISFAIRIIIVYFYAFDDLC